MDEQPNSFTTTTVINKPRLDPFEKVSKASQINIVATLAEEIWNECFTPIIGKAQVDYMLQKFQSRQAVEQQIQQGYIYFLINNKQDDSIGYMGVLPETKKLFLSKLYIKKSERNKAYGRGALNFLEKMALEKQLEKIYLTVNKYNQNTIIAYEKFGFMKTKEVIKSIGCGYVMDDYIMEKIIC